MSTRPEALRLVNNRHNAHMLTWQANACAELRRLHALNQELVEALKVLADEANGFSISGVYFNEKCMGHKGLDMAFAALAKAGGSATQTGETE